MDDFMTSHIDRLEDIGSLSYAAIPDASFHYTISEKPHLLISFLRLMITNPNFPKF